MIHNWEILPTKIHETQKVHQSAQVYDLSCVDFDICTYADVDSSLSRLGQSAKTYRKKITACIHAMKNAWNAMEMLSALLFLSEGNLHATGGCPSKRTNNAERCCFLCRCPGQTLKVESNDKIKLEQNIYLLHVYRFDVPHQYHKLHSECAFKNSRLRLRILSFVAVRCCASDSVFYLVVGCSNIWYLSQTHLKPKSREISFPHNVFLCCPIVWYFA